MTETFDLECTAYHEAGHAIAWLLLKKELWSPIEYVSIISKPGTKGCVTFRQKSSGVDRANREELQRLLQFHHAGYWAERKFAPDVDDSFRRRGARGDYYEAVFSTAFYFACEEADKWIGDGWGFGPKLTRPALRDFARQHNNCGAIELGFNELRARAEKECKTILHNNWPSVERLAKCLLLFGKVNGRFAECCLKGDEVVNRILSLGIASMAELDEQTLRILEDDEGLKVGPTTPAEESAWKLQIQAPQMRDVDVRQG